MPGKLGNEIQGFVDHVGYYTMEIRENKEIKRVMYFQPTKTYQAKNRFSNFNGIGIANPTMQDIFDLEVLNKSIESKEIQGT
jgi:cytidylate kinase